MKRWLFKEKINIEQTSLSLMGFLYFSQIKLLWSSDFSVSSSHPYRNLYLSSFGLDTPSNSGILFIFRTQIKNHFLQEAFPKLLQFPACTSPQAHTYTHAHRCTDFWVQCPCIHTLIYTLDSIHQVMPPYLCEFCWIPCSFSIIPVSDNVHGVASGTTRGDSEVSPDF